MSLTEWLHVEPTRPLVYALGGVKVGRHCIYEDDTHRYIVSLKTIDPGRWLACGGPPGGPGGEPQRPGTHAVNVDRPLKLSASPLPHHQHHQQP